MPNVTRQEWLNRNSYRRFPLVENSNMACVRRENDSSDLEPCRKGWARTGVELPDSVILDARFCLFGTSDGPVMLKSVTIKPSGDVSAVLGIPGSPGTTVGEDGVVSGAEFSCRIVFGTREKLSPLAGEYVLETPAEFLRSRVLSVPYGIGVDTLTCGGVTAIGDIRVVDGRNSSLDIVGNDLVLSLKKGLGDGVACSDLGLGGVCPDGNMLYYINGQKADSSGNIDILAGEGITVTTGTFRGIPAVIVCTSPVVNNFAYRY